MYKFQFLNIILIICIHCVTNREKIWLRFWNFLWCNCCNNVKNFPSNFTQFNHPNMKRLSYIRAFVGICVVLLYARK